jgi:hypothetical protein
VSLSGDGNTVAAGITLAPGSTSDGRGALNVLVATFDPTINDWKEIGTLVTRKGNYVFASIRISTNGRVLAVSHKMVWNSAQRSTVEVFQYEEESNAWDHVGEMLSFGSTQVEVSLSSNGHHLAVSGDALHSRVYKLDRVFDSWSVFGGVKTLGPASSISIDGSGRRIALQRLDRVSVFDYDFQNEDWVQSGEITMQEGSVDDAKEWNMRLAANGKRMIIGLPYYDTPGGLDSGLTKVLDTNVPVPKPPGQL